MKTLVELRVDQKVNSKVIDEVIELSKVNTPKPTEIVVKEDELDNRLILITFESYKGKQIDLADRIMKSYSHHLESYSDITVFFGSRNKIPSIEKRLALASRTEVIRLIEGFFKSIDKQDWVLMSGCLDERIKLIPQPPMRSSVKGVKASVYINQRKKMLSGMTINHEINNFTTGRDGHEIKCQCQIEIRGEINKTNDNFIAIGDYNFSMKRSIDNKLKITKIKREIGKVGGSKKVFDKYI